MHRMNSDIDRRIIEVIDTLLLTLNRFNFAKEHNLVDIDYELWPTNLKVLFKLTY